MFLITDGSVNPKSGIGFGAYLAFSDKSESMETLRDRIKLRKFENTSSTKLELQTLLWALSETADKEIISFTDSQNIAGLLSRKERLIENDFFSMGGRQIRNHEIYREFFKSTEQLNIQFRLISGHKPSGNRDRIDEIFSAVDRASRNALRTYIKERFQPVAEGDRVR